MERLPQYRGIHPNLDKLIDYALSHDFSSLVPGRNEIDGDTCWISNNVAKLVPRTSMFERHLEYMDLQIPIDEGEIITVRPVEDLDWPSADQETLFTDGHAGIPLDMVPGTFAVFFPGDAHNCSTSKAGQTQVRKLVGKGKF